MQFKLNSDVKFILEKLNKNGTGFLVGGAVRDLLSGKEPDDYDFATDIDYEKLKNIFADYLPKEVGASFGILIIKVNNKNYEIAKFRKESGILNSRHPKSIKFVQTIDDDLSRRDFTMNAMAYNENTGLIDLFEGKKDIENRVIKFVGNPKRRIEEDALRIMRAFRFISQLGFKLDKKTAEAIRSRKKFLNKISRERIFEELSKILLGPYMKRAFKMMRDLNVLEMIIPEFDYAYDFDQNNSYQKDILFDHILKVTGLCEYDLITRFSALFHDLGKITTKTIDAKGKFYYYGHEKASAFIAENFLREFRASNDIVNSVKKIILNHMLVYQTPTDKEIKKLIIGLGDKNIDRLFNLFNADILSKKNKSKYESQNLLKTLKKRVQDIKDEGGILDIKDMDITGVDLINMTFDPKSIGEIKNDIYDKILDNNLKNEKEEILKYLSEKYNVFKDVKCEKSCGAIILNSSREKFLIVKMYNGNWGFAKGHMENNETEKETAIREVKEETGLKIRLLDGFKEVIKYVPDKTTLKKVVIFAGIAENEEVKIDKCEIEDYKWCNYDEAMKLITYKLQRDILEKTMKFIKN